MTTKHLSTSGLLLLVLGTAILGLGGYLLALPEQFQATTLFKSAYSTTTQVDDFVQTEFEVLQSEVILNPVIDTLHLRDSWAEQLHLLSPLKTSEARALLKHKLQLRSVPDTQLIELTFTSRDPGEAAQIANAITDSYAQYIKKYPSRASYGSAR